MRHRLTKPNNFRRQYRTNFERVPEKARVFLIRPCFPYVELTLTEEAGMIKERLQPLADMLEAQIQILAKTGLADEAAVARQEVVSLRLLAEFSD
jgi:hypothetical protein